MGGRKRQELHGLDGCSGFRSFAACAAKAGQTILSLPAGGFGDAKVGSQQGPTELVAERCVSTRKTPGYRVAEAQGIPRDMEGIETMVVEGPWWSLHSRSFRLERRAVVPERIGSFRSLMNSGSTGPSECG
jgi:hypothetical protein